MPRIYPPDATCLYCDERPYARGLCRRHYHRDYMRRYKNPDIARELPPRRYAQNKGLLCELCLKPARKRGMCAAHYSRFHRRGLLEVKL